MDSFKHYILTRFNAGLYDPKTALRVPPDLWMEHRLRLFATITLPSIAGQTCQNFTWLVLMDRRTPERYIRTLESSGYANMKLIYPTDGRIPWLQSFAPGRYDLITTRIDNDDAFHRDTVKTLQATWTAQHAEREKPWVIVFPFGLIMDLTDRRAWFMEYWLNNCPTLVESSEDPRSICQWGHCRIPREVKKHYIKDKPYWVQVIHAQNLKNVVDSDNPFRMVRKDVPARPEHLWHFGIDPDALPGAGGGTPAPAASP